MIAPKPHPSLCVQTESIHPGPAALAMANEGLGSLLCCGDFVLLKCKTCKGMLLYIHVKVTYYFKNKMDRYPNPFLGDFD